MKGNGHLIRLTDSHWYSATLFILMKMSQEYGDTVFAPRWKLVCFMTGIGGMPQVVSGMELSSFASSDSILSAAHQ